jgi:hypothetical protein
MKWISIYVASRDTNINFCSSDADCIRAIMSVLSQITGHLCRNVQLSERNDQIDASTCIVR